MFGSTQEEGVGFSHLGSWVFPLRELGVVFIPLKELGAVFGHTQEGGCCV